MDTNEESPGTVWDGGPGLSREFGDFNRLKVGPNHIAQLIGKQRMSSIMDKYGSFVKEQIEYNERSGIKYRSDENRAHAYQNRAAIFRQLLSDLTEAEAQSSNSSLGDFNDESLYRLTPSEIEDLPEELLSQLSLTEGDKQEFLIAEIIKDLGGATSLDKLLIAIYRRTGEVEKRTRLNARLYRMANKRMIYAHPSRKGIYALRPFPAGEDQPELFDEDRQPDD